MIRILIILIVIISITTSNCISKPKKAAIDEYNKQEFLLLEKIFACRSLANTLKDESNKELRFYYHHLCVSANNEAKLAFNKMKKLDKDIDSSLKENIEIVIKVNDRVFETISTVNEANSTIALILSEKYIKIILKKILKYEKLK